MSKRWTMKMLVKVHLDIFEGILDKVKLYFESKVNSILNKTIKEQKI